MRDGVLTVLIDVGDGVLSDVDNAVSIDGLFNVIDMGDGVFNNVVDMGDGVFNDVIDMGIIDVRDG